MYFFSVHRWCAAADFVVVVMWVAREVLLTSMPGQVLKSMGTIGICMLVFWVSFMKNVDKNLPSAAWAVRPLLLFILLRPPEAKEAT